MAETKRKPGGSYRLTPSQLEIIEALVKTGVLGTHKSDVVRALLDRGIEQFVTSEYLRIREETLERIKNK
jgi:Arc/MetJ-type ribon-helix-helix transcriptional regulator